MIEHPDNSKRKVGARVTVKELQQLFYIEKIIQHEKDRLDELRASVDLHSPGLSDMPKAPGAKDKLGDTVPKIVDQEAEIQKNIILYSRTKEKLLRYINGVPFVRIKMIMILRFIDQKSWQEVADAIGGKETEYSVKKAVYRYLGEKMG
jgi:DNA-directed RNA polymerase specialized sigma subunit